jgi:uncharacterized protein GlcG (DUF336 family)
MEVTKVKSISYISALELISLAVQEAKLKGLNIAACVVDVHGRVKAKVVMDNTALIADELVEKKALTALSGLSTEDFAEAVSALDDIKQSMLQLDAITLLGGGYPLVQEGVIIGAFAVGGARVDQDIDCAKAVLKAAEGL